MLTRNDLRQQKLELRESLSPETAHNHSQSIQKKILDSHLWGNAETIGLYWPVRNEVDTRLMFMTAIEQGKTVYYPRVEQGISFYEVNEHSELRKGAWGIMEPNQMCKALGSEKGLDLLIVPGIVFDKHGYRLGYGKGFYDRLLEGFKTTTIGVIYDCLLEDEIPREEWDRKVDYVFSESSKLKIEKES